MATASFFPPGQDSCSTCGRTYGESETEFYLNQYTESKIQKYFGLSGAEALELHRDIYLLHNTIHQEGDFSWEGLREKIETIHLPLAQLQPAWESAYGHLREQLRSLTTTYRPYRNERRGSDQGLLLHSSGLELTWRLGTSMVYRSSHCCGRPIDINLSSAGCSGCGQRAANDDRTSLRRGEASIQRMGWWLQELGLDPLQASFAVHELQHDLKLINGFFCLLEDSCHQWAMDRWPHFWLDSIGQDNPLAEERRGALRGILRRTDIHHLPPSLGALMEEVAHEPN